MQYTPDRAAELITSIPWTETDVLRVFWIRHSDGSRAQFAAGLSRVSDSETILPLVVRERGFFDANSVLSDVQRIFEANRSAIEAVKSAAIGRLTVALVAKDDFRLPQGSSPIVLPTWFPICPGRETSFRIADLGMSAESALLNCAEARIEQVSALLFDLEKAIVDLLHRLVSGDEGRVRSFVSVAHGSPAPTESVLGDYVDHLGSVLDARAYRPNAAQDSRALSSRLLKLALRSSPKDLGAHAKDMANALGDGSRWRLKPTLFAVMLRPAAQLDPASANWHAILLSFYQAYQLMNGAAHAGDYLPYAVSLQYANSMDLRRFLVEARPYIDGLGC